MELYTSLSYRTSALFTRGYSTSFSLSSLLFPKSMRTEIYAVYGLVRIADEIVDTYTGADARALLDNLEQTTYEAITRGYDTNPIVHAFAQTARHRDITRDLIAPFFASMRIDIEPHVYNEKLYREYIYGSAEVVGLMCLRVFCQNATEQYDELQPGASALGAAYQKVNFLRDMAEDYRALGRTYFPGVKFEQFSEDDKQAIITDIEKDFAAAHAALIRLPKSSRRATTASYVYYHALLKKLKNTPAHQLTQRRVRISNLRKLGLLLTVVIKEGWKR